MGACSGVWAGSCARMDCSCCAEMTERSHRYSNSYPSISLCVILHTLHEPTFRIFRRLRLALATAASVAVAIS